MADEIKVSGLDHIVLVVDDVERSLAFYTDVLGLEGERVDEWRRGEAPFPSVRVTTTTIIDLFPADFARELASHGAHLGDANRTSAGSVRNLDHFCLVIEPIDLGALAGSGRVDVVSGPTDGLFGAQGYATSLYVRDPDGNTIELRSYT
jgi:catechol 2,3-dioxygenase-like lactoylglutathione lyase family enzyme